MVLYDDFILHGKMKFNLTKPIPYTIENNIDIRCSKNKDGSYTCKTMCDDDGNNCHLVSNNVKIEDC